MCMSVVLPAPFSPSRAWTSPARTSRLTRSLAWTPGNALLIPETVRRGGRAETVSSPGDILGGSSVNNTTPSEEATGMPSQLRRYTINRGKLGDFVAAWKNGVYPLRTKMGYRIQAWTIKERSEFVWILSYDGPDEWDAKDRTYHNSPERAA